jgi:uncharacterized protein YjaZ
MKNLNVYFLDGGKLDSCRGEIERLTWRWLTHISKWIPLRDIVVLYDANPYHVIPELGIGGYAPSANVVFISVNPSHRKFRASMDEQILRTLAHELHHCMRWRGPGYGRTLFEALITEGLADHFDIEVSGKAPPPWCTALSPEQLSTYRTLALKQAERMNYNHRAWFYDESKEFPRWTGYSVGFALVSEYLRKFLKQKASKLHATPASEFMRVLRKG